MRCNCNFSSRNIISSHNNLPFAESYNHLHHYHYIQIHYKIRSFLYLQNHQHHCRHNPLNKEQDFSVMAKTGKNLMAAHFVKPGVSKTRYPPIINVFSRTLASPINSSPFPLPLPHRIGSNLSLKCVGLYIHPEKKILMYESTYLHGFETTN